MLRLPRDLSLMYLDWFAIYDPQAKHSAGHVLFERDLVLPPNMAFMLTYVRLTLDIFKIKFVPSLPLSDLRCPSRISPNNVIARFPFV